MKAILSLALPLWGSWATHVYEVFPLATKIFQLVETEAVGWAVAVEPETRTIGHEVWFSTELGSGRIRMGPRSILAERGLIQLSLTEDDLMAMKTLKRDTQVRGIGHWSIPVDTSLWETTSTLTLENQAVVQTSDNIKFDFTKHDIELSRLPLCFFENAWGLEVVREYNSRLMVPCTELEQRRNGEALSFMLGGVSIGIHEVANRDAEFSAMRDVGWCPLNVILGALTPTIGRTILEQYDLVLDASNYRIVVLPKSSIRPAQPLMKYRLDRDFSPDAISGSWRWTRSPGRATPAEFLFTEINQDSATFKLFCLVKGCEQQVIPSEGKLFTGAPVVALDSSGAVTVRDTRGWERYAITLNEESRVVTIAISKRGYRFKRDPATTVAGYSMQFVPVEGAKEVGEFSIPYWPPVISGLNVEMAYILAEDAEALITGDGIWHGMPRFEVSADNRILVTAEVSDDTCDRRMTFFGGFPESAFLDFSDEICNYRQVEDGDQGYRFELMKRSETDYDDALRFLVQQGSVSVSAYRDGEPCLYSFTQSDHVWSPNIRWLAAPELNMDPETREISIRPAGELDWAYTHEWEKETESGGLRLIFKLLPK